ncbi:MAG: hypothetical protein ABI897_07175, partial [Spartobacteria bacterium]
MKNMISISRLTTARRVARLLAAAVASVFLLLATPGFAQAASPAPAAPGVHSKTLWEQIKEGGWVMFPIA